MLFGRFRGGLALATIGSCAGFGALTGSSLATAATIGRVAIPEMRARGYSPALATGTCAAGGTLGPLVPPGSGPIIVFAILTEASIGQLFVASVGPAILAVLLYFLTIMIYVRVCAGVVAGGGQTLEQGQLRATLRRCIPVGLLVFGVMGGLYFGIFTDTESAAVGAIGAFVVRGLARQDQPPHLSRGHGRDHGHHRHGLRHDHRRADHFRSSSCVISAHRVRDGVHRQPQMEQARADLGHPGRLFAARHGDGIVRDDDHHRADHHAADRTDRLPGGLVGHRHDVRGGDRHDPSALRPQCVRAQGHHARCVRCGRSTVAWRRSSSPT